jgi:hypothetical protein
MWWAELLNTILGGLSSPVTAFVNPASISNLYLWLDAADTSTFTYSSGSVVSQWNDKSANGYNATQATVAKQPSRGTTPNRVTFDGSNDVLITSASFNGDAFTIFEVVKWNDFQGILIGGQGSGTDIYFPYYDIDSGGTWYTQTATNFGKYNAAPAAGLMELEFRYDGTQATNANKMKFRYAGADQTLTFTGTINSTLSRSGSTTALGAYNAASVLPFNGYLSELIVYNRVLTTQELTDVRGYISTKWGITA